MKDRNPVVLTVTDAGVHRRNLASAPSAGGKTDLQAEVHALLASVPGATPTLAAGRDVAGYLRVELVPVSYAFQLQRRPQERVRRDEVQRRERQAARRAARIGVH